MGRTDLIVQKVRERIGDAGGHSVFPTKILAELDSVQLEIAQRGLAIKDETDLMLEKDTDLYDLGGGNGTIFRLKGFLRPKEWNQPITIVNDIKKWEDIVSDANFQRNRLILVGLKPPIILGCTHAMIWEGRLRIHPTPDKTGETMRIYFYRLPSKPLQEDGDPEVDRMWDNALLWGALGSMIGDIWSQKYEMELGRLGQQGMNESPESLTIDHWSDGLNF